MFRSILGIIAFILVISCQKDDIVVIPDKLLPILNIPVGFPTPEFPEDNEFTEERWRLGKKLFFDPIMSLDESISCASCHLPAFAFSDTVALSPGVNNAPGVRNSPSLANVVYQPYYIRDGGVPTLEMQVLVPIQEHNEFNFNILRIVDRLKVDTSYTRMSLETYEREPDPFVITRALATFERSLISGNSRYDQYAFQGNKDVLSEQEIRGMDLFFGNRTNCIQCHQGFNFTNYSFENNGLYIDYSDPGRYRLTHDEYDLARFKVPTLRNVEITAPYMHDGSLESLEEVVTHYNSGGKNHQNKNEVIKPLGLSEQEVADIVSFLFTLTDTEFINNPHFAEDRGQ